MKDHILFSTFGLGTDASLLSIFTSNNFLINTKSLLYLSIAQGLPLGSLETTIYSICAVLNDRL